MPNVPQPPSSRRAIGGRRNNNSYDKNENSEHHDIWRKRNSKAPPLPPPVEDDDRKPAAKPCSERPERDVPQNAKLLPSNRKFMSKRSLPLWLQKTNDSKMPGSVDTSPENSEVHAAKNQGPDNDLRARRSAHNNSSSNFLEMKVAASSTVGLFKGPIEPRQQHGKSQTTHGQNLPEQSAPINSQDVHLESRKDRHKDALLRVFVKYDDARIEKLRQERVGRGFLDGDSPSKPGSICKSSKSEPSFLVGSSSALSCIPAALAKLQLPPPFDEIDAMDVTQRAQSKEAENHATTPTKTRRNFQATTLSHMEIQTRNWHITNRLAQPRHSCKLRSLNLQFNECSLSGIARWCQQTSVYRKRPETDSSTIGSSQQESMKIAPGIQQEPFPAPNKISYAGNGQKINMKRNIEESKTASNGIPQYRMVESSFRKCSICRAWGHYELECPKKSFEYTMQFAESIEKACEDRVEDQPGDRVEDQLVEGGAATLLAKSAESTLDSESNHAAKASAGERHIGNKQSKSDEITVEDCDGFLIEQQSIPFEPEYNPASPNGNDRRNAIVQDILDRAHRRKELAATANNVKKTVMDGFVIRSAQTVNALNKVREENSAVACFLEGDLVAWACDEIKDDDSGHEGKDGEKALSKKRARNKEELDESQTVERNIYAGIVLQANTPSISSQALVHCVRVIPPHESSSDDDNENDVSAYIEKVGQSFWIPASKLYLVEKVDPLDMLAFWNRTENHPNVDQFSLLSRSQKNKRLKKMNQDGTMLPKRMPQQMADGTFAIPKGRRPVGLIWDAHRGLWVPKESNLSSKRKK